LTADVEGRLRADRIPSSAQPPIDEALAKLAAIDPARAIEVRRSSAEKIAARGESRLPGDVAQALQDLRLARVLDPTSRRIAGLLVQALTRSGRTALAEHRSDEGITRLREALALEPGDETAGIALGEALTANRDWAGAAGAYRKVLEFHPKNAQAGIGLAKAKTLSGPAKAKGKVKAKVKAKAKAKAKGTRKGVASRPRGR